MYEINNVSPNTSVVLFEYSLIYLLIVFYLGIDFHVINHLMHLTPSHLIDTIQHLNNDDSVDGIILQLPLPLHLIDKTEQFIDIIRSDKDVDAHTRLNNHSYRQSSIPSITIPVVAAVREFLLEIGESLQGKNIVVIGRSKYVGTPLALMLSQSSTNAKNDLISGATVTICHRDTHLSNLTWYCKHADVVISAVGRPSKIIFFVIIGKEFRFVELVTQRMIKEGAVVIDVGISKSSTVMKTKRFVGDVDFDG
jgi:5,10-methylene-tetrahydrofolate dehydrogenase/methenyl tetrahydrofolate cyclohydrolase